MFNILNRYDSIWRLRIFPLIQILLIFWLFLVTFLQKYATVFENERVGMVELPYLSEERLQKMGVPLGPRLRIMQEAQISVCKDNTLCIV